MSSEKKLRERISELEEELVQLKEHLVPSQNPFFGRFGLTPQLAAILWALYCKEMASNEQLDAVTAEYGKEKRSDEGANINLRTKVALCKLRRKLEPHGIQFQTIWGIGYRMNVASKQKLKWIIDHLEEKWMVEQLGENR